ncbi:MAG: pyridoxal phosphate-dependent aminotransferase [Aestuariivirgaceae bacterium]
MRYAPMTDRLAGLGAEKWHVHFRAREKAERGDDVLFLSIGEPQRAAPDAIVEEAVRQLRAGRTRYSNGRGEAPVIAAISKHYSRRTGRDIATEQVIFTSGTQNALCAAMLTLASLGDEVIVPEPYYVTYDGVIAATGASLVPVRLTPETGFHLSAGELARAVTPQSRVLLLNSPSNPTGAVLSRDEILAIGEVCRRHDLWIISDEVYAALVFGNRRFASPFDEPELAERTVVVSSLSKSHAMTGYRAGWAVGPEEFSARMQAISEVMLFGTQPFIQDAAAFALGREFPEVEAMRRAYESRARLIVSALDGRPGIRARMPEGGMFVFADIRPTGLSGEAFALGLLEESNVAVMPGEVFGPSGAGHIRLGLTVPEDMLTEALRRIAAYAERHSG